MKRNMEIGIVLSAFILTMACAFVKNLIIPPPVSPTSSPIPPPAGIIPTLLPTNTATSVPRIVSNPDPILCSGDDCLNECLARLDEVLETSPFDPIDNSIYEEQNANFNLVIYKVNGDQVSDPSNLYVPPDYKKYQEDTGAHMRIWDFYVAIIPSELRDMVDEFVIFTDGGGSGAGAWVTQSARDPDKWQVGFDLLDSDYPLYLADALIHETGHLLTLNTLQMPFNDLHYYSYDLEQNVFRGCPQYAHESACSIPDSYINLFYRRFWMDIFADWSEVEKAAQDAESFEDYLAVMEQFYDSKETHFINSYAATNIREDMAESFSYFVLNAKPTGDSIPEQKVDFYYDFPELIEYRHRIIEGLCSYINQ
jgi:hypothetical protein